MECTTWVWKNACTVVGAACCGLLAACGIACLGLNSLCSKACESCCWSKRDVCCKRYTRQPAAIKCWRTPPTRLQQIYQEPPAPPPHRVRGHSDGGTLPPTYLNCTNSSQWGSDSFGRRKNNPRHTAWRDIEVTGRPAHSWENNLGEKLLAPPVGHAQGIWRPSSASHSPLINNVRSRRPLAPNIRYILAASTFPAMPPLCTLQGPPYRHYTLRTAPLPLPSRPVHQGAACDSAGAPQANI